MKQSPAMIRQWEGLLEQRGQAQFRRSDLSARLYPLTNPRSRAVADSHADAIIQRAAAAGEIARVGHLHWKRVSSIRTLRSGRLVAEIEGLVTLKLDSHCARKWVAIDLETGDIWEGTEDGWKRAGGEVRNEIRDLVKAGPVSG